MYDHSENDIYWMYHPSDLTNIFKFNCVDYKYDPNYKRPVEVEDE
jgi:hypothetical protein